MSKIIIFLFTILSLGTSCNSKSDKSEAIETIEEQEKTQEDKKKNDKLKVIDELTFKYGIEFMLDTLKLRYSIDYEPILNSSHFLVDRFTVRDIFEIDSVYFVSVKLRGIHDFTFQISKEQIQLFNNEELDNILVLKIRDIKRIEDTGFTSKGELIEIVSLRK